MTSIFKIAEQVESILEKKVPIQDLIASVVDSYSFLVKREWYENQKADVHEVDGAFVVTSAPITPLLDLTTDQYYVVNPSSYVRLPAESGIIYVGFAKGQDRAFLRSGSGTWGRLNQIKAGLMGGRQIYYEEGVRTYFPRMTNQCNGDVILKLAVALDNIDPDTELNIPRSIINDLVVMVVQKYQPTPANAQEKIS